MKIICRFVLWFIHAPSPLVGEMTLKLTGGLLDIIISGALKIQFHCFDKLFWPVHLYYFGTSVLLTLKIRFGTSVLLTLKQQR